MHQCKQCWQYKPATKENYKTKQSRYCNACLESGAVPADHKPLPKGRAERKQATCHPERKQTGKGLCRACYSKNYFHKRYGYGQPVEGSNI